MLNDRKPPLPALKPKQLFKGTDCIGTNSGYLPDVNADMWRPSYHGVEWSGDPPFMGD